jgi:Ca2+-binding EF-hand superfamily protein
MRKTNVAVGVAAVLAVLTGSAIAQQAPQRSLRADADADGRISRAEFVDSRIARLTALDADGNGSVSAGERRTGLQAQRGERLAARFDALDKDRNGALSREEFAATREHRAERAEGARRGDRMGRHGPRGGRHHGGREAGAAMTLADAQTRLTAQFDRIDTNRDGFITAEERTAMRGAHRADRMGRRGAAPASPSTPTSE